jgi:hypothetical protein
VGASTDSPPPWSRAGALLTGVSVTVALAWLAAFTILVGSRAAYPYELEWIEGANLDEILWIADGHAPFGPPRLQLIPLLYTPLYFVASAALVKALGAGFFAPRLLSILASVGCFALLFRIVRQETGKAAAGTVAAGLYAGTFFLSGKWMDLAKVDSLFLFLVLSAFAVGRRACGDDACSARRLMASGVLWATAFFAKQLTLAIAVVFMPFSLVATRGRSWLQWSTALAAGTLAFWALEHTSEGWFSFFAMSTFTKHSFHPERWEFWKLLWRGLWPAAVLSILHVVVLVRRLSAHRQAWCGNQLLLPGFALALVSGGWAVYLKKWTYLNGLMPACLGLSLLAGVAFGQVIVWWEGGQGRWSPRAANWRFGGLAAGVALVLLQLGMLARHPSEALPTAADRAAARAFVERVRQLPGTVLINSHGYYGRLAGKGSYFNSVALSDVTGNDRPGSADFERRRQQVIEVRARAVSEQHFDWVIVDEVETSWPPWFLYVESFGFPPAAFYPVTGARTRPESLMKKNPVAKGGTYPLTDPSWNRYFSGSWSVPQPWGRWIRSKPAKRRRHFTEAAPSLAGLQIALSAEADYELRIDLTLDCVAGAPSGDAGVSAVRLDMAWNGQRVGSELLSTCDERTASFQVSRESIRDGSELQFLLSAPARYRVRITGLDIAGS